MSSNEAIEQPIDDAARNVTYLFSTFGIVFYCIYLAYISLIPFHNWAIPNHNVVQVLLYGWMNKIYTFDVIQNLLAYLPIGYFTVLILGIKRWVQGLFWGTVFAFLVSCSLEFTQTLNPVRVPSALDLMLNTLSGFLGGVIAAFFYEHWMKFFYGINNMIQPFSKDNPMPMVALMFIFCWCIYQWYPVVPVLHPDNIRAGYAYFLHTLAHPEMMNAFKVLSYACQAMLIYALSLISIKKHHFIFVFGYVTLILSLKIFMVGRVLALEALLGAFIGILCAYIMYLLGQQWQINQGLPRPQE